MPLRVIQHYSDWVCTAVMSNDVVKDLRGLSQNSYRREFCAPMSQIVFIADLTVLRLLLLYEQKCHKNHISASFVRKCHKSCS